MTEDRNGPPTRGDQRASAGRGVAPVTGHRSPVTFRSAFTLIELLVVLTIMVLLAALVAPTFTRQYHTAKLRSAARDVVGLMRYARSQAAVEGTTYRLNLDQESGRVWMTYYKESQKSAERSEFVADESVLGGARTLPEGVLLREVALGDEALAQLSDQALEALQGRQAQLNEERTPFIAFTPQGTNDGARILLEDEEYRDRLAISLDAITGRTEVEEVTGNANGR